MVQLSQKYKVSLCTATLIVLCSCNSYRPLSIRVAKKIILDKNKSGLQDAILIRKKIPLNHVIYITKYFMSIENTSPIAVINNKAISLALDGKFSDAEILFQDITSEAPLNVAAYNNLAIIYELFNNYSEANQYYLKAISIAPANSYIKNNFLSFEESKYIDAHNNNMAKK